MIIDDMSNIMGRLFISEIYKHEELWSCVIRKIIMTRYKNNHRSNVKQKDMIFNSGTHKHEERWPYVICRILMTLYLSLEGINRLCK